ncbi:hypothetical protein ACF1AB_04905 [Streptomyces sp. NPDC014846]|uniref:hypothetical protein n=1 Tax=unclassified Streptomyces TaxID=2593676 RepID=UPI0036F863DD
MSSAINYAACALLWVGLVPKTRDLFRHRNEPYLLALCAALALGSVSWLLGAPLTIGAVNGLSGVPNLAAPLTYAAITAYSAALLVLIAYWQESPNVRRIARRWIASYTAILAVVGLLFALGSSPVERRRDFDTYYAGTPFVREMIVLYLVAHLTAVTFTALRSLGWARKVRGEVSRWTLTGLLTLGVGTLITAGYSVSKLVAVGARWSGRDWDWLGTALAPSCAGLGTLLTVAGVLVPLMGQRWQSNDRLLYRRMRPLERELERMLRRRKLRLSRPVWGASSASLLTWRATSIHNGLSYLSPFYDPAIFQHVLRAAQDTDPPEKALAAAWAAVIAAAAHEEGCPTTPAPAVIRLQAPSPRTPEELVLIAEALKGERHAR